MEKMLKDSKITSVFVLAAEEQISHRDISVCDWVLWKLKIFLALSNVFVYFWNEEMWNNDFFIIFFSSKDQSYLSFIWREKIKVKLRLMEGLVRRVKVKCYWTVM